MKMKKIGKLGLVLYFLFFAFSSTAQLKADTTRMVEKKMTTSLNELKKQAVYNYQENSTESDGSFFSYLLYKFRQWLSQFFSKENAKTITHLLTYLFIGIMIAIVIMQLMGIDVVGIFLRKGKDNTLNFRELTETIHGRDFDEEIKQALQATNYRLAIRLLYLKTLKQLSDKELIDWTPNRTNRSYVTDLTEKLQKEFGKLTGYFEYAWYGNAHLQQNDYEEIKGEFDQFERKI